MTETTNNQPQTTEEVNAALMILVEGGDEFAMHLSFQICDADSSLNRVTSSLHLAASRVRDRAMEVIDRLDSGNARYINELGVLQGSGSDLDRLAGERHLAEKNLGIVLEVATAYLNR